MPEYYPRIIDEQIKQKLGIMGAVLIRGPKWCGKTTTAEQFAKSALYLSDPDRINEYMIIGDTNPSIMLEGEKPRLIDEWQVAPKLWDAIRNDVDHAPDLGRFILTGSSTPQNKDGIFHSGTGRFAWLKMRPMSLYESGDSTGDASLRSLFRGEEDLVGKSAVSSFDRLAFLICRGGWPQIKRVADEQATLQLAYEYVDGVINGDLGGEANERRAMRIARLLRSLARHQGTQASNETILADVGEEITSPNTLRSDLADLDRLLITDNVQAWNPNLRSKVAIRTSDTRYFVDPSIGIAALGLGPNDLMGDFNTFGLMFEALCIRDLKIYAEAMDGNVYHYRDKSGLECDAVIHLRNGKYGLIEIKLGGEKLIEEAAKNLAKMRAKITEGGLGEPAFSAVVTGVGNFAYRRPEDGVYVVPIGAMGV